MAVTYYSSLKKLFDGPATASQPGDWVRVNEAKQLRVWARASANTTIRLRLSIFGQASTNSGINRDNAFIDTASVNVTTQWTELVVPELDGPLDSLAVVPDANVATLQVYASGSAV